MNKAATVILIDGNSVFHSARQHGFTVDYLKLRNLLTGMNAGGGLVRTVVYTGTSEDSSGQQSFLAWLRRSGFRVVAQKVRVDSTGIKSVNLDVEIATDIMRYALMEGVENLVLVSGNESLVYPLEFVRAATAVSTEVACFRDATAGKLIESVDSFRDLTPLTDKFKMDKREKQEVDSDDELDSELLYKRL
jgi:uncharacterized LabA/DUF88 family protein